MIQRYFEVFYSLLGEVSEHLRSIIGCSWLPSVASSNQMGDKKEFDDSAIF